MTATMIMVVAVLLFIIARWTRNQPAVTLPIVMSGAFAIFVIALLDHGRAQEIARGLAWLFAVVAFYAASPGLFKSINEAWAAAKRGGKSVGPPVGTD